MRSFRMECSTWHIDVDASITINEKFQFCTYVLHSELLGAVNSNICVTLVLIRKNALVSTADRRTKIKFIFDMGLKRPSILLPSAAPAPGLLWNLRMYLSSCEWVQS